METMEKGTEPYCAQHPKGSPNYGKGDRTILCAAPAGLSEQNGPVPFSNPKGSPSKMVLSPFPISRRDLLCQSAVGIGASALVHMLARDGIFADELAQTPSTGLHHPAKARRI